MTQILENVNRLGQLAIDAYNTILIPSCHSLFQPHRHNFRETEMW